MTRRSLLPASTMGVSLPRLGSPADGRVGDMYMSGCSVPRVVRRLYLGIQYVHGLPLPACSLCCRYGSIAYILSGEPGTGLPSIRFPLHPSLWRQGTGGEAFAAAEPLSPGYLLIWRPGRTSSADKRLARSASLRLQRLFTTPENDLISPMQPGPPVIRSSNSVDFGQLDAEPSGSVPRDCLDRTFTPSV